MIRVLEDRAFPVGELRLFASARGAGSRVVFRGDDLQVSELAEEHLYGSDIVFFAAGSDVSRRFAPPVAETGGLAIDKSSAYRMDKAVPLIVPEVNPQELDGNPGIISNPNCVVIPLTVALAPLHRVAGVRHLTIATYQAASGAGTALLTELRRQIRDEAGGSTPRANAYPHVLLGNVVPGGWKMEGDDTEEEKKVIAETRRVMDLDDLAIAITTVRVPVEVGHSMAVWAEFDDHISAQQARSILCEAPSITVVDDSAKQQYPTPRGVAGTDQVHVGRIREDPTRVNGLTFFLAADNLRKGAATNAVQVAELELARRAKTPLVGSR